MRRRLVVLVGLVGVMVLGVIAPAFAHVTVSSPDAAQGGFSKLTFRVPNETDDANTTQVEIAFPEDQPLAFVSVKPIPGWTFTVKKTHLAKAISSDDGPVTDAITDIVWTGGSIGPGEFQEFDVSVGPLPDASSMTFKAVQTYDNGDVVRWIDPVVEGQDEPEHPTPILTLAAATSDDHHATTAAASSKDADNSSDTAARAFGLVGIALGAVAIGVAMTSRNKKATSAS